MSNLVGMDFVVCCHVTPCRENSYFCVVCCVNLHGLFFNPISQDFQK